MLRKSLLLAVLVGICGQVAAAEPPPPLPVEPTGIIETLPDRYPAEWFLVHDAAFFHMSDGKVYVIDTSKDTVGEQVQGMFPVNLMGSYLQDAMGMAAEAPMATGCTRPSKAGKYAMSPTWAGRSKIGVSSESKKTSLKLRDCSAPFSSSTTVSMRPSAHTELNVMLPLP